MVVFFRGIYNKKEQYRNIAWLKHLESYRFKFQCKGLLLSNSTTINELGYRAYSMLEYELQNSLLQTIFT